MASPTRGGIGGTYLEPSTVAQQSAQIDAARKAGKPVLFDAKGNAWMPAGEPMAVMVPDIAPRKVDFPLLWNRQTSNSGKPRDSGVTFAQLRALSRQTHVRVVLETVKDRMSKVEWTFTLKSNPDETPRETRDRAKNDKRIPKIAEFFEQPDRERDYGDWQRDLLEQVLVCDNLSILKREYENTELRALLYGDDSAREPFGVEILDGDTILPLVDDTGRRPQPPFPAYEQWIKGLCVDKFSSPLPKGAEPMLQEDGRPLGQLLYAPRNVAVNRIYSAGSPVEQLLFYINMVLRRDLTKIAFYTDGNIPAGFMPVPPDWTPTQIQQFADWLNVLLAGDPQARSRVLPVPGGTGKVEWAQAAILQDEFDDAWVRLVCFCFSIPVGSLVKQMNRATAQTSKDQAQEEGEQVLVSWLGRLLTKMIRVWFGWSDIVVMPSDQVELDAEKRAAIEDKQLRNGTRQINEVRQEYGYEPLDIPDGIVTLAGLSPFPTSNPASPEQAVAPVVGASADPNATDNGNPKDRVPPPFAANAADNNPDAMSAKIAKASKKKLYPMSRSVSLT